VSVPTDFKNSPIGDIPPNLATTWAAEFAGARHHSSHLHPVLFIAVLAAGAHHPREYS